MGHAHAAQATPHTSDSVSDGRIRFGRHEDLAAVARLIHRANAVDRAPHIDDHELEVVADRGQLLVLQLRDDELAAAACVAPGRGLVFLVIDPDVATPALEHRMIGVADALCEAEHGVSACMRRQVGARLRGRR
jgi:hypothetical protein